MQYSLFCHNQPPEVYNASPLEVNFKRTRIYVSAGKRELTHSAAAAVTLACLSEGTVSEFV
jgi:hypothetical protein